MGASLPTRIRAWFIAMKTSQFTFNQKFKVTSMPTAGKVMLIVFWNFQGVLLAHFQKHGENVNSASYCEVLLKLHDAIRRKCPGQLARGVLLHHDNARSHTAQVTQEKIQELQWELLEHPPYSLDLAPSDFHLFGPLKSHLGNKHFTDDEVEMVMWKWLRQQSKNFYAMGFNTLAKRWDKRINVGRGYVEKCFSRFEYHMFYVLYPFVTYLLTLLRKYVFFFSAIRRAMFLFQVHKLIL
jgi:histone-lysine N-methyltransferase SETMAR